MGEEKRFNTESTEMEHRGHGEEKSGKCNKELLFESSGKSG
jgi:hypothetical protein